MEFKTDAAWSFLNADDIRYDGLKDGQMVDLISHFEGEERIARRFRIVTVQYSASLCSDLFSRDQRAGAGAKYLPTRATRRLQSQW